MSTALPLDRRALLKALAGAAIAVPFIDLSASAQAADTTGLTGLSKSVRMTMEAFADTIVPGEKRFAGDVAIAGAAPGPGAVQAGALTLMAMPALGVAQHLPGAAASLDQSAAAFRPAARGFAALPYKDREALVERLTGTARPDRLIWVGFGVLSSLAFDLAQSPSKPKPGPETPWRNNGTPLAELHPATTETGNPA